MRNQHVKSKLLFLAILTMLGATSAKADPLLFGNVSAFQNNGTETVDLFSNVGAHLIGPEVTFRVDITGTLPPGALDTLLVTYTEAGSLPVSQVFSIPLFGTIQPPFTIVFSITSLGATFEGTPATLTIDLLNSSPDFVIPSGPNAGQRVDSYTYSIEVAKPVPEPATLTLLGGGIGALFTAFRKRSRSGPKAPKGVSRRLP
jgi:hypothetical protein